MKAECTGGRRKHQARVESRGGRAKKLDTTRDKQNVEKCGKYVGIEVGMFSGCGRLGGGGGDEEG
mgnify:FL=1